MDTEGLASLGFAKGADRYDRARPSYPDEAVRHLCARAGIGPGTRVLDLAAGTGKLTRPLAALGAQVTAVEPSAAMRETFARVTPGVPVVDGTAERIPFDAGSFDVVTVAQAFHWFDQEAALREIARVLRPGGVFAMLWSERDPASEWVRDLHREVDWPFDILRDHRPAIDASGLFAPCERHMVSWSDPLTVDQVVERVATFSYVVAMTEERRAELLERVRAFAARSPEPIGLAYVTDTYLARRPG